MTPALFKSWGAPALLAAIFVAAVAFYWSGFGPGDAERYLRAALRWQDGPWLGDTHWALRHLFVLPMAASFALFGASEASALLPNLLYAALTVAITWTFGRRFLGARDAFIAAALIAASAFFVARPLELDVYGAEAFYAALALWLFIAANDRPVRGRLLFAAGIAAGLAWTVREQSASLLLVFGLLKFLDRRDVVRSLALVAAGFGAVVAVEIALYAISAGDPFYRYRIDLGHRAIGVNAALTPESASIAGRIGRAAFSLASSPGTTPMLALAAVGAIYLRVTRAVVSPHAGRALKAFAAAAAASALLTPLVFNIASTRYYPLLTYAAFLTVAAALGALWSRKRALALAGAFLVIVVNSAAADFMRDNQYAEARFLAARVMTLKEPVFTDPLTVNRARYQLMLRRWDPERAADAVRNVRTLPVGGLYFNTAHAGAADKRLCVLEMHQLRRSGWTHVFLRTSGLARTLGAAMEARVAAPPPAILGRILDSPGTADPASGLACLPAASYSRFR